MVANKKSHWFIEDVATLLASNPTSEQLLRYRPHLQAQKRFQELVSKLKQGSLSFDDEWELNQFEHLEMLMQAVKARLRKPRS